MEGTTRHQIFMGGSNIFAQKVSHDPTNKFFLKVKGCNYKISVESSYGWVYETGFDGTLYQLIAMRSPTNVVFNGIVESDQIPRDDGTTVNYLWLAYASGCYFSGLSTNWLRPIWMLDDPELRNTGFTVPALWRLQTELPQLPNNVIYLSDGTHHTISEDRKPVTFRYPPPFAQGFTNAEYKVLTITNVDGLGLPVEFTFTRYYVDGKRLLVRTYTEGKATVFRKGTGLSDFRPKFTGRAITFDKRFTKREDPVSTVPYWVTNGNWPKIDDLSRAYERQLAKVKRGKQIAIATANQPNSRRWQVVCMLVLLTLIIPSIILIRTINKQIRKRKESK